MNKSRLRCFKWGLLSHDPRRDAMSELLLSVGAVFFFIGTLYGVMFERVLRQLQANAYRRIRRHRRWPTMRR